MRIAIVGHYASWALAGRDGYQADPKRHPTTWVMNLVRGLKELGGHEVHVVTQTDEVDRDMEVQQEGVTLHFLRCPRRLRAATLFCFDRLRIHRALRRISPDVVHAFGTEDTYGLAGVTSGFPCLLHMQCLFFKMAAQVPVPLLSRTRLMMELERYSLRHARHIVAMSAHGADELRPVAPHANVHAIPNAVEPAFFDIRGDAEPDRLLFAAIFAPIKGLEYLVAALDQVRRKRPGVKLAIVGVPGRGAESYHASIQEQIAARGLGGHVEWLGFQRPEGLAREMVRASVVVVPSLHEMFCSVAAEGMAVGRPVVASRAGALPELVDDGETGLLAPPADPDALAQAIGQLLADDARRARLGAAAREKARHRWHPKEVARQTVAIYQAVLADSIR
ncbi:MAG: glycosyltransferase [Verrucomicrobia bacterium]|nr:glycosyltransferase [Verrucomicrobiota bacterium]